MSDNPATPTPILFCITELDPGGAENALVQLVTRLDRDRWQPYVIALAGEGKLVKPLREAGIEVVCLNATSSRQFSIYPRLVKEFRRINPKIVQTYLFHANILGRMAARAARVKHVVSGIRVAERRGKWYHRVDRWTDRWVSKHVCVSQAVKDFTAKTARISSEKMIVIPNGVDLKRFENALPISRESLPRCSSENLIALYAGRLDPQKGVADLLTIAENLRDQLPELKWLIAGDGPLKSELANSIKEKNLQNCVQLLGNRQDIPELMQTADMFIFPSRWEGMPNVILEAMAARLPIITSHVEGIDELLIDQQSGIITPRQDIPAMTKAVIQLATAPDLRTSYSQAAFQKVANEFSWEQTAARYQELYQSLINNIS